MGHKTKNVKLKASYLKKFKSKGCVFMVERAETMFASWNDSKQPTAVKRY